LVAVRAPARENGSSALRAERNRLVDRTPESEPVREPGREAVAAAVRVRDGPRQRRRSERPTGTDPATKGAGGGDDDPRLGLELAGLESLGGVLPAPDEHVHLDLRPA